MSHPWYCLHYPLLEIMFCHCCEPVTILDPSTTQLQVREILCQRVDFKRQDVAMLSL